MKELIRSTKLPFSLININLIVKKNKDLKIRNLNEEFEKQNSFKIFFILKKIRTKIDRLTCTNKIPDLSFLKQ